MRFLLILITFLLGSGTVALAAEKPITMTRVQQQALGIKVAPVEATEQSWSIPYPAQVVVPNAQLRVVSALQTGLLETLLVADAMTRYLMRVTEDTPLMTIAQLFIQHLRISLQLWLMVRRLWN